MPETNRVLESFRGQSDLAGKGVFAAVCPLMLQKDLGRQFSGTISPWQLLKSSDMSAAPGVTKLTGSWRDGQRANNWKVR